MSGVGLLSHNVPVNMGMSVPCIFLFLPQVSENKFRVNINLGILWPKFQIQQIHYYFQ